MWDLSAATVWAVKSFVYGCCWGCLPPEGFALHPVLLVIPPSSLPWEASLLGGRSEGAWVPCYSTRVWAVSRQWMSSPFSEDANTYVSVLLWDVVAQAFSSALFACRESEMCLSSTCFCLVPFLSRALLLPFIQTLWSFFVPLLWFPSLKFHGISKFIFLTFQLIGVMEKPSILSSAILELCESEQCDCISRERIAFEWPRYPSLPLTCLCSSLSSKESVHENC